MFKLKKLVAAALAGVMMAVAAGCGGGGADGGNSSAANSGGKRVGVAMPTQSSQRWIQDGANMKEKLYYVQELELMVLEQLKEQL